MKKILHYILSNRSEINELFFPVVSDLNSINSEIDKKLISNNAWDLANDEEEYQKVIKAIDDSKKKPENTNTKASEYTIVVVE